MLPWLAKTCCRTAAVDGLIRSLNSNYMKCLHSSMLRVSRGIFSNLNCRLAALGLALALAGLVPASARAKEALDPTVLHKMDDATNQAI
jgi:hypothetical protein